MATWQRYWCPRDGQYSLADDGFLLNPEGDSAEFFQPDAVSFDHIGNKHCLALLGEPGIGKSTAIRSIQTDISAIAASTGNQVLAIDLSEHGSEDRLERTIVECPEFTAWVGGSHSLYLILDSLDECRIRIPTVAALLVSILRKYKTQLDRLYLRIACRTADWPIQFDETFTMLWGSESYGIYELLPLRRCDVADAAIEAGLDPDQFIESVCSIDAQPLAIKPLTLQFLLDCHRNKHALPQTQAELYESGCLLFCTELSPSRRDAGYMGSLDPRQRFAVAARIAAVMLFCRKTSVSLDPRQGSSPEQDVLSLADLVGGTETVLGNRLTVTDAILREVLATGLFSSRGSQLLGFSHQTYAEYLAAQYLVSHQLDWPQLQSLIYPRDAIAQRVIPQLTETVAWLSSMNRLLFHRVMSDDPLVLLRSDAATADHKDRADLVAALLAKLDAREADDQDWSLRSRYGRFVHPTLAEQLLPYITDKTKYMVVRRVAIDIAEEASLSQLQDTLITVALDVTESYHIRDQAAHAIVRIGDDDHHKQFMPLLNASIDEDPEDQLRGSAMRALWPNRLCSLNELLSAIAPPRRKSLFGAYSMFLSSEFASDLQPHELPAVIDWLIDRHGEEANDGLQRLFDTIVLKSLKHLDDEPIRSRVADYAIRRLEDHDGLLSSYAPASEHDSLLEDTDARKALLDAILNRISDFDNRAIFLITTRCSIVHNADLDWLLDEAESKADARVAKRYGELVRRVFNISSVNDVNRIAESAQRSHIVHDVFARLLDPIIIDSESANNLREEHEHYKATITLKRSATSLDPPMAERVLRCLDRFEGGDASAWWQLNYDLMFDSTGHSNGHNESDEDLRELPGWHDADEATRKRIVGAADPYLRKGQADNDSWLGTNTIWRPARAGYRALVLLAHEAPELLEALPANIWARWAAAIMAFPATARVEIGDDTVIDLAAMAYEAAREEVVSAILAIIDKQNTEPATQEIAVLRKLEHCWDSRLCDALSDKLNDTELIPSIVGSLLRTLLAQDCHKARIYAEMAITLPIPIDGPARSLAYESAVALVENAHDAGWQAMWPIFETDKEFAETIVEAIARWDSKTGKLVERLNEPEAAKLYVWLTRQYPHAEDPDHDEMHSVGAREAAAHFRDSTLRALEGRGTIQAVEAIRTIVRELPELDWLQHSVISATNQLLRQSWLPPQPKEFLKLCQEPHSRLVRSAAELQGLLCEVLDEIDAELQGETPAAPDLWNLPTSHVDKTKIRPQDENRLSDWLKRRLEDKLKHRGIVALREAQIRRGEGKAGTKSPGERTDLHVIGTVPGVAEGTYDPIRVIIEVKGCWNPDVLTAMESQLVGRYLKDNDCQHGIYLVGWYYCPQWVDSDHRKKDTPRLSLDQAKSTFEKEAGKCSIDTISIRSVVLNTALR